MGISFEIYYSFFEKRFISEVNKNIYLIILRIKTVKQLYFSKTRALPRV
jgi:hypothetical protein